MFSFALTLVFSLDLPPSMQADVPLVPRFNRAETNYVLNLWQAQYIDTTWVSVAIYCPASEVPSLHNVTSRETNVDVSCTVDGVSKTYSMQIFNPRSENATLPAGEDRIPSVHNKPRTILQLQRSQKRGPFRSRFLSKIPPRPVFQDKPYDFRERFEYPAPTWKPPWTLDGCSTCGWRQAWQRVQTCSQHP